MYGKCIGHPDEQGQPTNSGHKNLEPAPTFRATVEGRNTLWGLVSAGTDAATEKGVKPNLQLGCADDVKRQRTGAIALLRVST